MIATRLVPYLLTLIGLGAATNAFHLRLWSYGEPAAGLFPFVAGILLVFTSLACTRKKAPEGEPVDVARLLIYCGALAAFCVLLELAGFAVATLLFLAGVLIFIERMDVKAAVVIAVAVALSAWGLFEFFLSVPLPRGLWRV